MNCALILSNYKMCWLFIQLEPRHGMFIVISDIMTHWYVMFNTIRNYILQYRENELHIDVLISNHYGLSDILYNHLVLC